MFRKIYVKNIHNICDKYIHTLCRQNARDLHVTHAHVVSAKPLEVYLSHFEAYAH